MIKPWIAAALFLVLPVYAGTPFGVRGVSRPFFNPTLGQDVAITVATPTAGSLAVQVLDRDGYVVRSLIRERVRAGERVLRWDGRDATGAVVPDEAYSLRVDLITDHRHLTYFPAAHAQAAAATIPVRSYDRASGVIAYDLAVPSRVHLQAGSAIVDQQGQPVGPVLKTVVDEQPRTAGSVVEQWNGFDESGTISVSDQPHFVMSLVATPLPDHAMITVGNRAVTFLNYAVRRTGASLLASQATHAHHVGLRTMDDMSPPLDLTVTNATWSAAERAWRASQAVQIIANLKGPIANRFAEHSQTVLVFVDNQRVLSRAATLPRTTLSLPSLTPGAHIVAVNWVGRNGPVAVSALRLLIPPHVAAR